MQGFVPLESNDPVFLHESRPYALVTSKSGWRAAAVVERNGSFYRSDTCADLGQGIVDGVVHQQEWFAAARLPDYWKRRYAASLADFDAASRRVADLNGRIRRHLGRIGA